MKRIIAVVGEKGGTGKSLWASSFLDYARNTLGRPVAAYDADGSVGALAAVHAVKGADGWPAAGQDPLTGVVWYDIRKEGERALFLDSVGTGDALILHDMAGGCLIDLAAIVAGGGDDGDLADLTAGLADAGYRLTLVHVLSEKMAAADSVGRYVAALGDAADHVAVVNRHFGTTAADFPHWAGGSARDAMLAAGGAETDMPALPRRTFARIEPWAEPLSASLTRPTGMAADTLTTTERIQINAYRTAFEASVLTVADLLGLPAGSTGKNR